jgi:hypothetical protein
VLRLRQGSRGNGLPMMGRGFNTHCCCV